MVILLSLVFILNAIFYWKWIHVPRRVLKLLENIPGPKSYPLIASLPFIIKKWNILNSEELLNRLLETSLEFGGIFKLWFANEPIVVLTKGKHVEALLSSHKHLEKSDEYHVLTPGVGKDCLLTMKADDWRVRYKLIAPAIQHTDLMNTMLVSVNKQFDTLLDIINNKFQSSNEKTLRLNLESFFSKCMLDIVVETGTGIDMQFQTDTNHADIHEMIKGGSSMVFERLFKPWLRPDLIWNFLKAGREEQEYVRIARNYTKPVIEAKIKAEIENIKNGDISVTNEKKNVSFFDRLYKITAKGNDLSFNIIYEEINLLVIAGHDTTSGSLHFTMYLLAVNPEYQKLVYEELVEIFGNEKNPEFEKSHLSRMKFTEMCIKESLRLFPPIPFFGRKISSDLDLGDGMFLPSGITVGVLAYALHRDPEIFDNPEEFRPERFSPENCKGRSQYDYTPFSIGPRNCVGQKHALMLLKSLIGKFILNFSIESETKREDLIISPSIVLKTKNPIFCKITKRD